MILLSGVIIIIIITIIIIIIIIIIIAYFGISEKPSSVNLLRPTGNYTYHKVWHSIILHCDHTHFVCFVWISEQTANFALHNFKRSVFITEMKSVYSAVRTGSLNKAVCA